MNSDKHLIDFMRQFTCTVIPAREGWSLGLIVEDAEPEWTEIIAWKIFVKENSGEHFTEPVTPNDSESYSNEIVLRHPDGSVEQVDIQRWKDWTEASRHFRDKQG